MKVLSCWHWAGWVAGSAETLYVVDKTIGTHSTWVSVTCCSWEFGIALLHAVVEPCGTLDTGWVGYQSVGCAWADPDTLGTLSVNGMLP